MVGVGDGVPDGDAEDAGHGGDVPGLGPLHRLPAEALEEEQLGQPDGRGSEDVLAGGGAEAAHLLAADEAPADEAADADAAPVGVVVQGRDEQLQRPVRVDHRRGDVLQDGGEQGPQVSGERIRGQAGAAVPGDGVDHGVGQLVGILGQLQEEVGDLLHHLGRAGVLAVDLVDHHQGAQAEPEGQAEDEAGLREGALGGVDQQEAAVRHGEGALHLAREVRVAGGVDQVDLDLPDADGGVLGEDGDPPLPLQLVAVHDQRAGGVRVAEGLALLEQAVDERRLAVIDVGDDGDVAQAGIRARPGGGGGPGRFGRGDRGGD